MTQSLENLIALAHLSPKQADALYKNPDPQKRQNIVFEKVLNEMIAKELLSPLIKNGIFSKTGNYGYLLQDSLAGYLSDNMHLINIDDMGVR